MRHKIKTITRHVYVKP